MLTVEEEKAKFEEYFEARRASLSELEGHYPQVRSYDLDYRDLAEFDSELADAVQQHPDHYQKAAQAALEGLGLSVASDKPFKPHVRFSNLPDELEVSVQNLGSEHLSRLFRVAGVVNWVTEIKPRLAMALWECVHCGTTIKSPTEKLELSSPPLCRCGRRDFKLIEENSEFVNIQRAQVQELVEKTKGGTTSASVELWMEDDLVNHILPGEKIVVTGTLRLRPQKEGKKTLPVYQKFVDVFHVHKMEQEFEELAITSEEEQKILALSRDPHLFEQIVKSIAPSIYGYDEMKSAIALQLFGGTPGKILPDGEPIRNDSHILLIGDPGCLIGDERIILGNGAIQKLDDLGSSHLQAINQPLLTGQGYHRATATVFHAYPAQPILEVVTESGKSIKGTYNHPLLTVKNRERTWKRLDEINVGDRLAVISWIPCSITKLVETGWKPLPYRRGPRTPFNLPHLLTPRLAGLLGYVLGDGWVTRTVVAMDVNSEEQDLVPLLTRAMKQEFKVDVNIRTEHRPGKKPMTVIELYNTNIAANLRFLREHRVPPLILRSGNAVAAEFIAWLFEADGCVFSKGRGSRAIQLKSASTELLRDVQILLLRFGIHSRLNEHNLAIRCAQSIRKYAKHVGFRSEKKKHKLAALVEACNDLHHEFGGQRSERVVRVRRAGTANVYDVEVPGGHRFIANGVISHNTGKSTLLQYVQRLAPKCVFVSGKGASGVGLTASAEKDKVTEGWILKAGAMVLASGGQVNIDEFDKMNDEDRSAIHEAMEQQKISIAKAGIITTLPTKTAILAGANPKLGRFDPNSPPAQQFDIPPTLLSRFDLIFTIKDVIDESQDRKMAEHILIGHEYAARKRGEAASGIVTEEEAPIIPPIDANLLRKYIAYARRNIFPVLTPESGDKIKSFYLEIRQLGKANNNFPITARSIEGIIRLAEASAKLRLSNTVEVQDAERAIRLQEFVLRDVFTDRETGRIDSDIINIGQPKSKLDRVRTVLGVIENLQKNVDLVAIEDVVRELAAYQIDEVSARRLLEELKRQGDLYEPKAGHIKVSRPKQW